MIVVAYAVGIAADCTAVGRGRRRMRVRCMSPAVLGLRRCASRPPTGCASATRSGCASASSWPASCTTPSRTTCRRSPSARRPAGSSRPPTRPRPSTRSRSSRRRRRGRSPRCALMVGALRDGDEADLAPQPASPTSSGSPGARATRRGSTSSSSGDLDDLRPAVGAARLPARAGVDHQRGPARPPRDPHRRRVDGDGRLRAAHRRATTASPASTGAAVPGYGLVGHDRAGHAARRHARGRPGPDRGWTVDAVLPRTGAAR